MVLGISEIQKLIESDNLIENLSNREIYEPEGTVIDLRIEKLFELEGEGYLGIEERDTPNVKEVATFDPKKKKQRLYTIKPGEYYMTKTIENINLPNTLVALFKPRSTLFRSGIIYRSGFANPGYQGPLYFGIYNAGPSNFKIEMGARYCSVYFMEIKGDISNPYRGQWQGGRDTTDKLEKQI